MDLSLTVASQQTRNEVKSVSHSAWHLNSLTTGSSAGNNVQYNFLSYSELTNYMLLVFTFMYTTM
jgi:hypothetical protein